MSKNKFGDNPMRGSNDYDDDYSFDSYGDDSLDSFKHDYDDYSLTRDDEMPLTSERSKSASDPRHYDEEPLDRAEPTSANRSPSRRETIQRIAEEQQNGIPRNPGVTASDTRLVAISGTVNPYAGRRLSGSGSGSAVPGTGAGTRGRVSSISERAGSRRGRSDRVGGGNRRPPGYRFPSKSKFAAFYIVLLLLAVGVFLTVIFVAIENIEGVLDNLPVIGSASTPPLTPPPNTPAPRPDRRSQTALVTGINSFGETRTITLLDINSRRTQDFTVPEDAIIRDRNTRPMTFPELRLGNILDIEYDARSAELPEIITIYRSRSPLAFEHTARTNVQINIDESEITFGNEVLRFIPGQTLVLYRGESFPIGQIRAIDSVTLVGYGDTVWFVQLEAGHGFLQFTNPGVVANGTVVIGGNMVFLLDEIPSSIELPEGTHQVVVEGANIETFIENVVISQGQTTRLDMGDAPLRAALLHINVTPEDALIFVNGELHEGDGPAQVKFGEVHVRVERHGFLSQEERREIVAQINSISFELVEIVHDQTLVIFTVPTNAEIFIDNVFAGFSTLTRQGVSPGTYRIVARLPGYESPPINMVVTGHETEDIFKTILLMPVTTDPFANMPSHDVEPLPPATPVPFPTLPPATPFPTPPPGGFPYIPLPELPENEPWWLNLPPES